MADATEPVREDAHVWAGTVDPTRSDEHEHFIAWLQSDEAQEVFRRKRLTRYRLAEASGEVVVLFTVVHTGDPRVAIDFLRYPGIWPEFWTFTRGGRAQTDDLVEPPPADVRVDWRRVDDVR